MRNLTHLLPLCGRFDDVKGRRRQWCYDFEELMRSTGVPAESNVWGLRKPNVAWATSGELHYLVLHDYSSSGCPVITRISVDCYGWNRCDPPTALARRLNLPPNYRLPREKAEITLTHEDLPGIVGWLASLYAGHIDRFAPPPGFSPERFCEPWNSRRHEALAEVDYLWSNAATELYARSRAGGAR